MTDRISITGKNRPAYYSASSVSNKSVRLSIQYTAMLGVMLSGTLMASEPDKASISDRAHMGIEGYGRIMDALDIPDAGRLNAEEIKTHSGAGNLFDAMQAARDAQIEALEGEDRRFGYIDMPDMPSPD